jgi:hypothetical protein
MNYPEDIINKIKQQNNNLDVVTLQTLSKLLVIPEIRNAVEIGKFQAEHFLIKLGSSTSVLSPIIATKVISQPLLVEGLQKFVDQNLGAWLAWDKLSKEIQAIIDLPRSRAKEKQIKTKEIYPKLTKLVVQYSQLLSNEFFRIEYELFNEAIAPYLNAMTEIINENATRYFQPLFESLGRKINKISFSNKKSGVQLGTVMQITYQEKSKNDLNSPQIHEISYHIKTHQQGSTSQNSSTKPIDPKELFVYKLLEYIGFGPKTYFFFNPLSPGGFFIATQDIGFTKSSHYKKKTFFTFEKIMEPCNKAPEFEQHEDARANMIRFDLLSRFLRLQDTTTNPGNFGRVAVNTGVNSAATDSKTINERVKWKLIDFRTTEQPDFYLNKEIFSGFRKGNGAFNYSYSNFLQYVFKDPEYQWQRMKIAKQLMLEFEQGRPCQSRAGRKMSFQAAIKQAHFEIENYIKKNYEALKLNEKNVLEDLASYAQAIQTNFSLLNEGIDLTLKELNSKINELTSFKILDSNTDNPQKIVSLIVDYL